jgi:hypothetical protein
MVSGASPRRPTVYPKYFEQHHYDLPADTVQIDASDSGHTPDETKLSRGYRERAWQSCELF